MPLTQQQVDIVKSTVPVLRDHGETITSTFYRNLLGAHPELRNYFSLRSQETGAQPAALAGSVLAYAAHIDDLPKLRHAVERIAQKHTSLFVRPDQYPIVGEFLVAAFGEVLGDALTDDVEAAWVAAYDQLADIFIQREAQLYKDAGDWQGWRKFKIAKKAVENSAVTSFYLEPVDGGALPIYLPGQYISLQIPIKGADGTFMQSRQYSLVGAPNNGGMDSYRISVKREKTTMEPATLEDMATGKVPGLISNLLHDQYGVGDSVQLSHPRGEFFIDVSDPSSASKPLILLSAGVGAAPLHSILDAVLESPSAARPISWIHAARSSDTSCYQGRVRGLASRNTNVTCEIVLKNIQQHDVQGEEYDHSGRLDLDALADSGLLFLDHEAAEYYICGPEGWMLEARTWLQGRGVELGRQHLELFKTGDV